MNNQFKILLVGDSAVGKTSLLKLYKQDEVATFLPPTLGCDYHIVSQQIDDKKVKLFLWDTAGQEQYRTISRQWYRQARGVLIIFSVIDLKSFQNVESWMNEIVNEIEDFSLVIVGNKTDLKEERKVTYEQGEELAKKFKVPYFETSIFVDKMPDTSVKIADIFIEIARDILKNERERELNQNDIDRGSFKLDTADQEQKKGCRC